MPSPLSPPRLAAGNLFDLPASSPRRESFDVLLAAPGVRVERIVSRGQASPDGFWYDQEEDEWVMLVRGEAALAFEDGTRQRLGEGDWIVIPARCRHRVDAVSDDAIWLAAHVAPVRAP